eukprot:TRINITY_DN16635_c0_g1_i7.p2 TRINITY_DN16635_c0_g1~~TRINITY_DN16635_c0_g1_i7.p2  ORF type:complete len:221 (+),score=75.07 TRINITY_DN16635_c0_g1_i7:1653-2315(+)
MHMVKKSRVLLHLDLSHNLLKDTFPKTALDALKLNTVILAILLQGNRIDGKWVRRIESALKRNKKLKERRKIPGYIKEIVMLRSNLTGAEKENKKLFVKAEEYEKVKSIADAAREELDAIESKDKEMLHTIEATKTEAEISTEEINKEIAELEAQQEKIKSEGDTMIDKLNNVIQKTIRDIGYYKESLEILSRDVRNKMKNCVDEESKLKELLVVSKARQ